MSLSISVECSCCGCELANADPTYNLAPMWRAAGFDHKAVWGRSQADSFARVLDPVVAELEAHPDKYRAMNPENGWGDYDGLVEVFQKVLLTCIGHPSAVVEVSG